MRETIMASRTTLSGLAAAALLAAGAATAQAAPPDPVYGLVLATTWCSACHVVTPVQQQANADAPSFFWIADSRDDAALTLYLSNPHGPMPTQALSRLEIADIVAYIRSLEK